MAGKNYYDVTEWNVGDPYKDIGEVINSMLADIKSRQTDSNVEEGGKPGLSSTFRQGIIIFVRRW